MGYDPEIKLIFALEGAKGESSCISRLNYKSSAVGAIPEVQKPCPTLNPAGQEKCEPCLASASCDLPSASSSGVRECYMVW